MENDKCGCHVSDTIVVTLAELVGKVSACIAESPNCEKRARCKNFVDATAAFIGNIRRGPVY